MKNALNFSEIAPRESFSELPIELPIVVHSHLHWDWVWQRPQQFLSRLSVRHPILFIEEPWWDEGNIEPYCFQYEAPGFPNIQVLQFHLPEKWRDDLSVMGRARIDRAQRELLMRHWSAGEGKTYRRAVQWFYDPMAFGVFDGLLKPSAVVYDCMDELAQFKAPPPHLIERERALLNRADVVFAGGRKMWESKSRFNHNCHFYGCGVDVEHFARARKPQTLVPDDLDVSRESVLGYFGVVDERMDYELVAALADANSNWTVAIVGPHCKVDPDAFPQRPNLQWLGGKNYQDLPAYAKGFDVCLMPFALNEATEYINPTKTLEYMATGTPVVSTAVPDVESNFAEVVKIAHSQQEFIDLCRRLTQKPDNEAIQRGLKMAEENTWDAIVEQLENHLQNAICRQSQRPNDAPPNANGIANDGVTRAGVIGEVLSAHRRREMAEETSAR